MSVSLDADIEALRGIGFFAGFSHEHLKLIAFSSESRSLPEKLLLYDEGQLLHSAYVIVSGGLRAERKRKDGPPEIRDIGGGTVLGERALILDMRASESVRVVSRASVLQIRRAIFRRLLHEHPQIAITLRARLSREVMQASAELDEVAQRLRTAPG